MKENENRQISGGFTGKIYNLEERLSGKFLDGSPDISFKDILGSDNWEHYVFKSNIPLNGYDEKQFFDNAYAGPFFNDLLCCKAQKHCIIFTKGRKSLDYFVDNILKKNDLFLKFTPCLISVDSFVKIEIVNKNYILTSIYAYYKGIGESLKTVRLIGDDIGSAGLFYQYIDHFNIYRCGIKDLKSFEEIISFSTDGAIFINYNQNSLRKLNEIFRYLKDRNFI
jgi:hypothetical protein